MESPRKFNDCYFYYYSTCTKGDNCVFRHEPSALGCETMCTAWQQGKCLDKHCKLRHMELRKNRKQIPCYWENQPGGCRKKHCPFMHKNPDARTDGIAPSQPAPPMPAGGIVANPAEPVPVDPQPMPTGVPPAVAPPAPVPLLWQQQRPVVLDSTILGVLPTSSDLLAGRRVVPHGHAHAHAHADYGVGTVGTVPGVGAVPVDPLVVNFEEESDNESGPSYTPTKTVPSDEAQTIARTKSQELFLLEKIQAEAAAFYSYDGLPPVEPPKERKLVRTNLSTKYDKLSLDEIAGKTQCTGERRNSLDFKVLSLDEIRARKKSSDTIIHSTPITLNLSRKRKLSTQETITTSGNKIIKVVRSNSIVYKKLDHNPPALTNHPKAEQKQQNECLNRKRTLSEQSVDIYDMQEVELVDNCYEFKRIKVAEQTSIPRLIRNPNSINRSNSERSDVDFGDTSNRTDDSDSEVQIINVSDKQVDVKDSEVIVLDCTKNVNSTDGVVDIVDLSDDLDDGEVTVLEVDLDKNVPDVVASCQKNANTNSMLIQEIDEILGDSL